MFTLRGESRHALAVDLTNGRPADLAGTLDTAQAKGNRGHGVVAFTVKDHGQDAAEELAPTLRSGEFSESHANGGVMAAIAFSVTPSQSNKHFSARPTDKAQALTTLGNKMSARGGDLVLEPIAFALRGREDGAQAETHDAVSALRSASGGSSRDYVAFAQNTRDEVRLQGGDGQVTGALGSNEGMKQRTYVAEGDYAIRRLTPTECERLMGFPDGYTAISFKGKPAADAPRYKALGNSMAVPVIAWLGRRIEAVDKL